MRISQIKIEHLLHRQHVLNAVKNELEDGLGSDIDLGVKLLKEWLDEDSWKSKKTRQEAIRYHDKRTIVLKIISNITLACKEPLPLVSIASMTSLTDELSKLESIQLAGEVIAVLAHTELYSVEKNLSGTYVVQSLIEVSDELERRIRVGCYLPPMIENPQTLYSSNDSGYKTIKRDSLILAGKLNEHSENISLDVLNRLNSIKYSLDPVAIQETKPFSRDILDASQLAQMDVTEREKYKLALNNHEAAKEQFNHLKTLLIDKTIYFTHKVDKRGRVYSQGHHFNPIGSSYEKSCLDLAHKETVEGSLDITHKPKGTRTIMPKTKVVNKYKESHDVYIGRGSKWGNPYSFKAGTKAEFVLSTREEAIDAFKDYILNGDGQHLLEDLHELQGKTLGCFCKPQACHGDILAELANEL